jgi:hypothetical protein
MYHDVNYITDFKSFMPMLDYSILLYCIIDFLNHRKDLLFNRKDLLHNINDLFIHTNDLVIWQIDLFYVFDNNYCY